MTDEERRIGLREMRLGPSERRTSCRRGKGYYDRRKLGAADTVVTPEVRSMRAGLEDRRAQVPIRRVEREERRVGLEDRRRSYTQSNRSG